MTLGNNEPKVFGRVGIDNSQLKEDVKEAKAQLKALATDAGKLGEVFDKLGVSNNLSGIKTSLENTRRTIKETTGDVAKQFEESAKKVAAAKKKVVEAISHNYSFGNISPEDAHQQLKNYINQQKQMMGYQNYLSKKRNDGKTLGETNPGKLAGFNSEIVKAEALMKRVWDDWQKTQRALEASNKKAAESKAKEVKQMAQLAAQEAKEEEKQLQYTQSLNAKIAKQKEADLKREHAQKQTELTKMVNDHREALQTQIELDKARYRAGEIDFIQYLAKLKMYEKQAMTSFSNKDMNVFAKERMRVDKDYSNSSALIENKNRLQFEREFARQSKEIVDNIQQMRKAGYVKDVEAHREMLSRMLANESSFTRNDLRRLQQEAVLYDKKSNNDRLQAVKDYNREVLKVKENVNSAFGSAEQRFKSLSNYAFDSSLIYGSIQGVKEIARTIKEIEAASTNLSRVIPELSPDASMNKSLKKSMVDDLRKQSFEVGKLTGTQVADVQQIQNLWARASDSIAKSKDAMTELTKVTAMGLQTGGFESADQAVNLLNATLNQMGLSWTEAEHVMSSWVKVADTTAVGSAKDLAEMISRVGTQGKMMGLTYHDLNAMTAVFANNMSRSGEEIGTAMKTVFSYFEDDKTIKTLEKYGVQVKKNAREYNNFNDVMRQLGDSFQRLKLDNNTQAIAEMSNALGRIRRRDYVGVLLEHWNETRDVVQDSLNSLNQAGSYLQQQSAALGDTYEHKINSLKVAFQELAWSIGESGLLDHLKALVAGLSSALQWFSNLDPVMKSGILMILEMAAALTIASKGIQILTGTGLIQFLANASARLAMLTQSQNLLNMSVSAGQSVYAVNTAATTANTVAKASNAAAQETVNIVDSQGNVILSTQSGAMGANTAATAANTAATQANAASQLTLNNAKQVGAASTGLLGGAIAGLANPITAVISLLGIATTAFFMYKQNQEEARKETEAFKTAQVSLQQILNQKVVDENYIPELTKKAQEMDTARKKYSDAAKGLAEAKKTLDDVLASGNAFVSLPTGGTVMSPVYTAAADSVRDYGAAMSEAEKSLKGLGTSTETVSDDLAKLNSLVVTSSDATTRKAYSTINVIEKDHKFNDVMREQVARYQQLIAVTNRTTDEELELKTITNSLSTVFPQYAGRINQVTKQREFDIKAILAQIGVSGELTDAQLNEIKTTVQLDEATKQAAINIIQSEIEQTKAKKENTEARINMMRTEMQAMSALLQTNGIKPIGFKLPGGGVTKEQIASLKASGDVPLMVDDSKVYDYLSSNNKLALLSGSQDTKEVDNLNGKLAKLEGTLKTLQGIKPFDPKDWGGTPLAGDDKKKKKKAKAKEKSDPAPKGTTYLDFQNDKLEIINSQINILKSQLDMLDDTEENRQKRIEKTIEIRDKENQKVQALKELTGENSQALDSVNSKMESYISGWSKMDGDQKLAALNKLSDASKGKVSSLTSEYQKLTEKMRSNQEQTASTEVEIKKLNDQIESLNIQVVADAFSNRLTRVSAVAKYTSDQLDRDLSKLKNTLDEIDDRSPEASSKRLTIDAQLIDKENEKIKKLTTDHKTYNDLLWEVNQSLEKQIVNWDSMSGVEKITALNSLTSEQKQRLQPLIDLWKQLSDLMTESSDGLAAANKASRDYTRDMEAQIEAEYRKGLELEKQVANRRLLAKQEKEQSMLETRIFGTTKEIWEKNSKTAIDAKQKEIDKLREQAEIQEHVNKLKEIELEIDKVKNDTRFAYIDEATGKEIYTYDRAKVKDLEKQKADLVSKKAQDDVIKALENQVKAMQDSAQNMSEIYDRQLADLQKYQQYETESFNHYWDERMDDQNVQQNVQEMIRTQGYTKALNGVRKFNSDMKATYDSYNKPMYDTGVSLTQSLMNGMSSYIDQYIAQKNAEMYSLGVATRAAFLAGMNGGGMPAPPTVSRPDVTAPSYGSGSSNSSIASVVDQMKRNSASWFTASPSDKARLEAENQRLGYQIGARKDANGDWIFPKYHEGGFIGGRALNPRHEMVATMLKGELAITPPMMDRLYSALTLPSIKMSSPASAQVGVTSPTIGRSINISIQSINANNFDEMMRSLDPYIDSLK
ncbi:phage tail tape measure protein [Paenibacillus chitinolyticus]|uniref:phage tail tape measure protein n=1 Tax=Paenibacillus chitinolyticus TaxID=79263 RepID=UPI003D07493A